MRPRRYVFGIFEDTENDGQFVVRSFSMSRDYRVSIESSPHPAASLQDAQARVLSLMSEVRRLSAGRDEVQWPLVEVWG